MICVSSRSAQTDGSCLSKNGSLKPSSSSYIYICRVSFLAVVIKQNLVTSVQRRPPVVAPVFLSFG